jgi:hypothetical protein
MGQGYKEAYTQSLTENLQSNIVETNLSAANVRSQLAGQTSEAIGALGQQFQTEVANMDRVSRSLGQYLDYTKTLTGSKDASKKYLSDEQMTASLDTMYETLYTAQPRDYIDDKGNVGISYAEWVQQNTKDTQADRDWTQWLFGLGGFDQFKQAAKKGVKS